MGLRLIDQEHRTYQATCDVCAKDVANFMTAPRRLPEEDLAAWAQKRDAQLVTHCSAECAEIDRQAKAPIQAARQEKEDKVERAKAAFQTFIEEHPDRIMEVLESLSKSPPK